MLQIDEKSSVWYAKYTPYCVNDMILPSKMKQNIQDMVNNQKITHLGLFSNTGGLGKSALCHAILKEIGGEAIKINASIDKGIDVLRGKIAKFAKSNSFDDNIKIVVMDEFDNFTPDGQKAFRGFIDEFGSNCMFIFTGNFKDKIIEPLLTRMEVYDFDNFPKDEMIRPIFERLKYILENENVKYDQKDIINIMNTCYPSIRTMIGALQQFTVKHDDGTLALEVDVSMIDNTNVYADIMKLRTPSTYFDMVKEVNKLASPDNMYSYMYKHASELFKPENYPKAIVTMAKYQAMSSSVRNKNLNLAACLTEMIQL